MRIRWLSGDNPEGDKGGVRGRKLVRWRGEANGKGER